MFSCYCGPADGSVVPPFPLKLNHLSFYVLSIIGNDALPLCELHFPAMLYPPPFTCFPSSKGKKVRTRRNGTLASCVSLILIAFTPCNFAFSFHSLISHRSLFRFLLFSFSSLFCFFHIASMWRPVDVEVLFSLWKFHVSPAAHYSVGPENSHYFAQLRKGVTRNSEQIGFRLGPPFPSDLFFFSYFRHATYGCSPRRTCILKSKRGCFSLLPCNGTDILHSREKLSKNEPHQDLLQPPQ